MINRNLHQKSNLEFYTLEGLEYLIFWHFIVTFVIFWHFDDYERTPPLLSEGTIWLRVSSVTELENTHAHSVLSLMGPPTSMI